MSLSPQGVDFSFYKVTGGVSGHARVGRREDEDPLASLCSMQVPFHAFSRKELGVFQFRGGHLSPGQSTQFAQAFLSEFVEQRS
jgi:hypothetical protein